MKRHPGVAKLGIALEWGSRGPEFESQHSDHEKRLKFKDFRRFSFCFDPESKNGIWNLYGIESDFHSKPGSADLVRNTVIQGFFKILWARSGHIRR